MRLKKANAVAGLFAILLLVVHAGYQVAAYILFIYNPLVTKLFAWILFGVVAVHIVLAMGIVFFSHEGSSPAYPELNRNTRLQR